MRKIKALRTTFVGGKPLEAGKIYEVEDRVAKELFVLKKAQAIRSEKKATGKVIDEAQAETKNTVAQEGGGLLLEE